jgi:ABC-2 type transport system ATP-binding protein
MIRIEGLTRRYGSLTALDAVSLEIGRGHVYGLIGPNGAGKTTLIRILAGLLEADAGRAAIDGVDVAADPLRSRSLVGWMPDFFGVYAELTAREYLLFFASAHGLTRSDAEYAADRLLDRVGLGEKRNASVGHLSRGMVQRLVFARTLVHDPPALLLDEPASGLDPRARIDLRDLLLELAAEGKTILISSHILAELAEMVDEVGIIERGRLLYSGPVGGARAVAASTSEDTIGGADAVARRVHDYELRVTADTADAAAEILAATGIEALDRRSAAQGVVGFRFNLSTAGDIDGLLAKLVTAGVRIRHFSEHRDVERLFLDVTKGETQ